MKLAPVVVFAYNRPDHLRRTLEALAANPEAKDSLLYIFCDGPKENASEEQRHQIEEVHKVAKEAAGFLQSQVILSATNKGLANSVIDGVTYVVGLHGSIIVLEDDALASPFFLRYMNDALTLYSKEEKVISVAGFVYPVRKPLPETFFLLGADCIAWATWKRGWDLFEKDGAKLLQEIRSRKLEHHFDFNSTYPYTAMLEAQIQGKNDSWAIRWYASAYLANKLTLYPGRPVIKNIGFDGSGVNSGTSDLWKVEWSKIPVRLERIALQDNQQAREAFSDFFVLIQRGGFRQRFLSRLFKLFRS